METDVKEKRKLSDLTFDQLASARLALSTKIKDADDIVSALKEKRSKIDVEFLRRFTEQGITNVKTKIGYTPYIVERTSVSVADKDAFWSWMDANKCFDFMEVRADKAMVVAYKNERKDLPPGLNWSAVRGIGMKKS